jgi:hypothetical protein
MVNYKIRECVDMNGLPKYKDARLSNLDKMALIFVLSLVCITITVAVFTI